MVRIADPIDFDSAPVIMHDSTVFADQESVPISHFEVVGLFDNVCQRYGCDGDIGSGRGFDPVADFELQSADQRKRRRDVELRR